MDEFMSGLENLKVEMSMRSLRVCPEDMTWSFVDSKTLNIEFVLPPGAYATAVLNELICFNEP
jgi:tRNA pseudouridine13 synthase